LAIKKSSLNFLYRSKSVTAIYKETLAVASSYLHSKFVAYF